MRPSAERQSRALACLRGVRLCVAAPAIGSPPFGAGPSRAVPAQPWGPAWFGELRRVVLRGEGRTRLPGAVFVSRLSLAFARVARPSVSLCACCGPPLLGVARSGVLASLAPVRSALCALASGHLPSCALLLDAVGAGLAPEALAPCSASRPRAPPRFIRFSRSFCFVRRYRSC